MIKVEQMFREAIQCETMREAADLLVRLSWNCCPKITENEITVVELYYYYIPGDCYEPGGFKAVTPEWNLEIRSARARKLLEWEVNARVTRVQREISLMARLVKRSLFTSNGSIRFRSA